MERLRCFFTDPPVGEANSFGEIYLRCPDLAEHCIVNDETFRKFREELEQYEQETDTETNVLQ